MSLVFLDGFDDGLFGQKWTVPGSQIVQGGVVRTGTGAIQQNSTSSMSRALGTAEHVTVGVGAAFNLSHSSDCHLMSFQGDSGATTHVAVRRSGVNALYVTGPGGTLATTSANAVTASTWFQIEVKVFLDNAAGRVIVRLNGNPTPVIDFTGDTRNAGTDAMIDNIIFGGENVLNYYDDIFIWTGAGAVNNDFLGDCRVRVLYPNGNGNYSQWIGSDANSVDNYLLVDEAGTPSTADYVESGVAANKDAYPFTDLPLTNPTAVKAVMGRAYALKTDAGTRLFRHFTRVAGTDYPGTDQALAVAAAQYQELWEVNPATGVAWTLAEVNAAEFGVEVR